MCTTFISVSGDQRKNGAAAVSMHTPDLSQHITQAACWPEHLLIPAPVTKAIYSTFERRNNRDRTFTAPLSTTKTDQPGPHFQPVSLGASVILACMKAPAHDQLTHQAYL